ncbi:ankyrin repeat domain-containing protein [Paenibacillus sp. GSMTC-2017]|uniref:stalk domain-containing protein n=1 Tax=Paenibacillus sp. GSMTC-2017 TaxID=2794350 RepID=UPI0018D9C38A|nr:stalk domain-containing protein [Paenibacillus sp. GSMTC-2017]MBH5319319.1 ankyrin repeat domain-containing protein [Paenibacillus sp. GSMTC-2017]
MKILKSLLLISMLVTLIIFPTNVFAGKSIEIIVDREKLNFNVPPIIQEGTTLVPFRTIFEKLGFSITWDQETQSIVGNKSDLNIQLKIGNKTATINGKSASLEVAPTIINGSTFVPLRFIGESANGDVYWDGDKRVITIYTIIELKLKNAVLDNDVNKVKELLKQGADPDYVDYLGMTPLEWAIPDNSDVVEALLEGGADPNKKNELGNSPLHLAIIYTNPQAVKLLIDAKADLNVTDAYGITPLDSAKNKINVVDSKYKPEVQEIIDIISKSQNYGSIRFDGMIYEGDLLDGVPNGKGIYTMDDGSKYEGEIRNGKPDIHGKFTLSDGTYYEGQHVKGVLEGQGTFVMTDKSKYVGQFKNGKFNGFGTMYAPSGSIVMQGEFKDGYLIRATTTSTGNTNNNTNSDLSGTPTTKDELKEYLKNNFGELNTSLGTTKFTFDIYENNTVLFAYDYWIMVKYESSFFYDVKYSNKITSDVRAQVKQELKDHQERIGRAVVQAMPSKKFDGGYYDSWYRYPNIKVDLITRRYFSWNNYEGTIISSYEETKPSSFKWETSIDDEL